jgi:rRNA-processing protein FCF1
MKISIGNDQELWKKTLEKALDKNEKTKKKVKQIKKSEKRKKAKNKKHGKKMLWNDKESLLPTIILDECIYSESLHEKVNALGYNVLFMGSGLPDDSIRSYMRKNPKNVLITADKEFDAHFTWKECLMCENQMPDHELLELIKAFMWIYEEEAEEQKLNAKKNSTNPEGKL